MDDNLLEHIEQQLLNRWGFSKDGAILAADQLKIFSFMDWLKVQKCEGKADSTSEKDLRVCEVSNSLPLILGLDNPYPLRDVLERLKWATNYLLHEKNYDGHSYEELNQCVRRANEIIRMLNGNGC